MGGSVFGESFRVSTFGESHGAGVGVVVDGCPAGLSLSEKDIEEYLSRRRPGQSRFTTARNEADAPRILSGVFEGRTTGTPIAILVENTDQRPRDYAQIMDKYRPGHADFCFDEKYGFRDYRGGGRSSARETIARVAAGAVAAKLLGKNGISVFAYTKSIGNIHTDSTRFDAAERDKNPLAMADPVAAKEAADFLDRVMSRGDSAGGIIECFVRGLPAGVGEPVFDKLDAKLAQGIMSIGAVKGFEVGDGFAAARSLGSQNNDSFYAAEDGSIKKKTNHAGGILGGISDGSDVIFRAALKPTPSISIEQETVDRSGHDTKILVKGRHDPVVVPRAVVVVECMAAIVTADLLLRNRTSRVDA